MSVGGPIAARVAEIRRRIEAAAQAAKRDPGEVTLVAVCKRQPLDRILAVHDCGVRDFGENTAQGLKATGAALAERGREVRWHFVGALQTNKINAVLPYRPLIHSLDRLALAEAVAKRAAGPLEVLLQVNLGQEPQKAGADPAATLELAAAVAGLPALALRGLMTLPPVDQDPRPYFTALGRLSAALCATEAGRAARDLSMGMSDDFEIAIECGATLVRVGTALFGEREIKQKARSSDELTPIDIQQQQFNRGLRGFDAREVNSFLELVAQQMGEQVRETNELKNALRQTQRELDEHRDRETTLREAMLTAQRAIDDIRLQAEKQAEVIITEADLRAEKLLLNAHKRVTGVLEDIQDLKRQRARAIEELKGILNTHQKLIALHEEQGHATDSASKEATVTVLERVRAPAPPRLDASVEREEPAASAVGAVGTAGKGR